MNFLSLQEKCVWWRAKLYSFLISNAFDSFGAKSLVFYPVRVYNPSRISIGKNVHINSGVWLNAVDTWSGCKYDGSIVLDDEVIVMNNTQISSIAKITLKSGAAVGRNCVIVDHNHDYKNLDYHIAYAPLSQGKPIVIEEGVMIAVNCVVGPGVTIGKHSFIGANSVVTQDIPPYSYASGFPAQVRRRYDFDAEKWVAVT